MSFFAADPLPEPVEEREPYRRPNRSMGPSPDEVGRPIAASFVLARTDLVAVTVQAIRAYSTGCLFQIGWILRRTTEDAATWRGIHDAAFDFHGRRPAVDSLLFGVVLGDGTVARTNDRVDRRHLGPEPHLIHSGGGGTGGGTERIHGDQEVWLTPLPPAPTMELVCAWPRFGLAEHRRTIDTAALREAASHARWVWPEDADLPDELR
jgi:hypothetical protein